MVDTAWGLVTNLLLPRLSVTDSCLSDVRRESWGIWGGCLTQALQNPFSSFIVIGQTKPIPGKFLLNHGPSTSVLPSCFSVLCELKNPNNSRY